MEAEEEEAAEEEARTDDGSRPEVKDCRFVNNTAHHSGGAVAVQHHQVRVRGLVVLSCHMSVGSRWYRVQGVGCRV